MVRSGLRFLLGQLAHHRRDPCEPATAESFVVQYSAHRLSRGNERRGERSIVKIAGGITASVIIVGLAAVGFASPASADDFGGTYNMVLGVANPVTWTVTPCSTDPNYRPFIPCVRVAETGGNFAPWEGKPTCRSVIGRCSSSGPTRSAVTTVRHCPAKSRIGGTR